MNDLKFIVNQTETTAEMLIYNNIGSDGTSGQRFAEELKFLESFGLNEIKVRINSGGGSVLDGFAIFTAIYNSPMNVNTYVDGIAASMAGVIAMAGKKRYMVDFGKIMVHDPHVGRKPDEKEMEVLRSLKQSLVSIFANNTKLSTKEIDQMMAVETWLNSDQAVEYGMIDEVYTTKRKIQKKKLATASIDEIIEMACAVHGYNKNENENEMELIKNHFGLAVESTENEILDAVKNLENKVSEFQNANAELNETINSLTETKNDLLNQVENAADSIKDLENKIAELKVDQAIASGKLDATKRDELVEIAQNNTELFETMLNAFKKPVVKISNLIGTQIENGREKWNIRDWEKNDPQGLKKMKNENVEQYNALFNAYYKKSN
jgi:ATP-dependent Clp endopeptidase proteolytic subunit ClpP